MKHCFIINPFAGRHDSTKDLEEKLEKIFENRSDTYEIYVTTGPNDATIEIKKRCIANETKEKPEDITFYICGGDGTCFEAINGIVGYPHARMTIVPVGSCNDFLKSYPECDFSIIENLIDGEEKTIDVLKVNDRYSLNVANIGYDAKVNYDCVRFRYKYKTVKQSYNHAIIRNILKPLGDMVKITTDNNEILFNKKALLIVVANGQYYGGGFRCAPYAICDDGLLDIVVVKKVNILTFARLIKYYKIGEHLANPKFNNIITYGKSQKVTIESDDLLCLCLDGETFHMNKIEIESVPNAVRFVFPRVKSKNKA